MLSLITGPFYGTDIKYEWEKTLFDSINPSLMSHSDDKTYQIVRNFWNKTCQKLMGF